MAILKTKVKADELLIKLKKFFNDLGSQRELLDQIGHFSVERVRAFTRKGKSLVTGDGLDDLSEKYVEYRRTLEPGQVDTTFFKPSRSNLTLTGQLLKSLLYKVKQVEKSVIVEAADKRRVNEQLTNKQLSQYVADNGRPFLGLDETGVARIRRMVQSFIRKEIIKQRLRKR